jgi:hypothetical protein
VFLAYQSRETLRRWIAAAAALTLALHVLLSPLAIGKAAASQASANGDVFVICHGAGSSSDVDQDGPAKQPLQNTHCILCTLTHGGCAVLPDASLILAFHAGELSQLVSPQDSQVTAHRSPTGEYQRGPPTISFIAS